MTVEWPVVLAAIGAVAVPTASILVAVLNSASTTRDRIDGVRSAIGTKIDLLQADVVMVKRDFAVLTQRVNDLTDRVEQFPARPVDETVCRERHESTDRRVADLKADVRAVEAATGASVQPTPRLLRHAAGG